MDCKTCVHYGIYQMITSDEPYGYGGEIPCSSCSRFQVLEDKYEPVCHESLVSHNGDTPNEEDSFNPFTEMMKPISDGPPALLGQELNSSPGGH